MAKKLRGKTKLAFAVGDIYGGGSFNIVNFLYPTYAAITLGLGASLAGIIVMISKIWDAFTDPVMGYISDRTSSPLGKRRIYILAATPFVVISLLLLFFPWNMQSTAARFAVALLCYMFFSTVQTVVMIPYYSLSSEISSDYTERAKANTLRLAFSVFSSIICVAVPNLIVNAVGQPYGYVVMSAVFGLFFAVPLLFTSLFAKEQVVSPKCTGKFSLKEFLRPMKSPSFRKYMTMHVCCSATMAVMSGLFFFYVMYVVKSGKTLAAGGVGDGLGTFAAGAMFLVQIIALPFYLFVIKKAEKRICYRVGAIIWIVTAVCLIFVPSDLPDEMNWLVYLFAAIMGFGISGAVLSPHTMVGDVNDAFELQFGFRAEGVVSGLLNFVNKVAQALCVGIALNVLEIFGGFTNPDPGQLVASQPQSAQTMLTMIMAFAPLILLTAGIICSFSYRITKQKQKEMASLNASNPTDEQRLDFLKTL